MVVEGPRMRDWPVIVEDLLATAVTRHQDGAPAVEVDDLFGATKALLAGESSGLPLEWDHGQA